MPKEHKKIIENLIETMKLLGESNVNPHNEKLLSNFLMERPLIVYEFPKLKLSSNATLTEWNSFNEALELLERETKILWEWYAKTRQMYNVVSLDSTTKQRYLVNMAKMISIMLWSYWEKINKYSYYEDFGFKLFIRQVRHSCAHGDDFIDISKGKDRKLTEFLDSYMQSTFPFIKEPKNITDLLSHPYYVLIICCENIRCISQQKSLYVNFLSKKQ